MRRSAALRFFSLCGSVSGRNAYVLLSWYWR
jgi:hypothetical protein